MTYWYFGFGSPAAIAKILWVGVAFVLCDGGPESVCEAIKRSQVAAIDKVFTDLPKSNSHAH